MTYTVILFITRNSNLTSEEFKHHYENTHIPLVHSLVGSFWPKEFRRRYLARISRKGFGGPANPDRPLLTLRGSTFDDDYDCIAELSFTSEEMFHSFYKKIYERDVAAVLAKDEEKFLEPGKTRVVVVGESWITDQNGVTTNEISPVSKSDGYDSEASASGRS